MSIDLLIVDDEKIFRSGLRQLIESTFEDINVLEATNGLEALEILEAGNADAMFLDINMPKMDGLQLLEVIKNKNISKIPTIIVSGYDDFEYARRALRNEVLDYLLKPLTPDEAIETTKRLLEKVSVEQDIDISQMAVFADKAQGKRSALTNAIIVYIEKHYKEEISIGKMSEELKYNANYLSQHFKLETGCKLNDYIRLFRVQKAKKLLSDPAVRIGDVAVESGIPNSQYFSTVFKRATGLTPQEYRENSNKN